VHRASAFGAKCSWQENELPYAGKIIADIQSAPPVGRPNPATDGLLPFVLNRLKRCRAQSRRRGTASGSPSRAGR